MNGKHIIIIGGGAGGLMSAIVAARELEKHCVKTEITILEKNDRVGKKLLSTGNGRCNITNINADIDKYHGSNVKFALSAIKSFSPYDAIGFFESIGVFCRTEDDGKVYPITNQAGSVLDLLRLECNRLNINQICNFCAESIKIAANGFDVVSSDGKIIHGDTVIVATGSLAGEKSRSTNAGYKLLTDLGHTITPLHPALVQLKSDNKFVKSMSGIKVNAKASAYLNNEKAREEYGEVLFTDYGLSGPAVFALSRLASENGKLEIALDLLPDYNAETVYNWLTDRRASHPDWALEDYLTGIVNKRIGQTLIRSLNMFSLSEKVSSLKQNHIKAIAGTLKHWRFNITGTMPWQNAQVCAGGIVSDDFDPKTLQSKKVKGLYAVGEILDIDGDCGGYNLQWAWSCAAAAGKAVAQAITDIRKDVVN